MLGSEKKAFFGNPRFVCLALLLGLSGFLTTCDMSVGMGEVVDLNPPVITIETPKLNESFGTISLNKAIEMAGKWNDETDITLGFQITEVRGNKVFPGSPMNHYTVNNDGTWNASVYIPEPGAGGEAEYNIRVIARDSFKHEGAESVIVRVDVVAPWIEHPQRLLRHPDPVHGSDSAQPALQNKKYYDGLINFADEGAYRSVKYENIDFFQNEPFTLKVNINANFSGVAASRLFVLDETGARLNNEALGLPPSKNDDPKAPEWIITPELLRGWKGAAYDRGAHYLSFDIWAWNGTEWIGDWKDGSPKNPDTETATRKESLAGTVWYPESDRPHISARINTGNGMVTLDAEAKLELEVYDDDRLAEIYAVLIPREDYESSYRRGKTDEEYIEELRTNTGGARDTLIVAFSLQNLFSPGMDPGGRWHKVDLDPKEPGEYRLIALAKDSKSVFGEPAADGVWGAYPALRVHVLNPQEPITIIEGPAENTFPVLGGEGRRKFTVHGYTIDQTGTEFVQIAWYPAASGKTRPDAERALDKTAGADYAFNGSPDASPYIEDGIRIWKLPVSAKELMNLNGKDYYRNRFSKEFDIVNDFMYDDSVENAAKQFLIHTKNSSMSNYRDFSLENYAAVPVIDVAVPFRDYLNHNTNSDLELYMKVSERAVPLNPASFKITDVTPSNNDPNYGLNDTSAGAGEKKRTIPAQFIKDNFVEGSQRTYRFEAADILNNLAGTERHIRMSNLPALQYISSSNAANTTYGIGEKLNFQAVFSMPVKITGTGDAAPRLKVYFSDPGGGSAPAINPGVNGFYAELEGGSVAASTVVFTYTVPEGVKADRLFTHKDSLEVPAGVSMESNEPGGGLAKTELSAADGNLQDMKENMAVDGIRPVVTGATFGQTRLMDAVWPEGDSYFNKGKTVTLELHTDKEVRISGLPKASLVIGQGADAPVVQAAYTRVAAEAGKSVVYFSYTVADAINVPSSQLSWTGALVTDARNNIRDLYGNEISLPQLSTGRLNGSYVSPAKRAHVITQKPAVPVFKLYKTKGVNGELSGELSGDVRADKEIYIKIDEAGKTKLLYSVEGGNNALDISAGGWGTISDKDAANKDSAAYKASLYRVTAWREDYAGNVSERAETRNVDINSRAPELSGIRCVQANGSYRSGEKLTFKLIFSRAIKQKASGPLSLTLKGTRAGYTNYQDEAEIDMRPGNTAGNAVTVEGNIVTVDWTVVNNKRLMNIKAQNIILSGLEDEYGNTLKNYVLDLPSETLEARPIANDSSFNLDRDASTSNNGLVIDSLGPKITGWSPAKPETASGLGNGGELTGNRIVLSFDKPVRRQAGKNIIVRPWHEWAVPPVLSKADFDSLYNSVFYNPDGTQITDSAVIKEYQKRLQWRNMSGFPETSYTVKGSYSDAEKRQMLIERSNYNYYTYTTRGVENRGGKVRPDLEAKWVLAFRHDIYRGVERLREVFNAARWNWYVIPSSSSLVSISGSVVTITLPVAANQIPKGRIWELVMDAGAFMDTAGNDSEEIKPATEPGQGYRFWSRGTADPVIRVDRYSQGDHFHGIFDEAINAYAGWGDANRPKIDTRVRIDCETPGASIIYDTVRTKYRPGAAGTGTSSGIFTGNSNSAQEFFNHFNVPGTINQNIGWNNNTIGNGGLGNQTNQISTPRDGDGYFTGLLVPNSSDTAGVTLPNANNGAVAWNDLAAKGAAVKAGTGRSYRSIQGAQADFLYDPPVFEYIEPHTRGYENTTGGVKGRYFYIGDAYKDNPQYRGLLTDRNAVNDTDYKLFTGRRDYITASAQKKAVNSGPYAGPELAVSVNPDYEGVFKTTLLHRNPKYPGSYDRSYRIILQGYDTPTTSTIAGFPLNEFTVGTPDTAGGREELSYFSKQLWRVGNYTNPAAMSWNQAGTSNNYIWVSWDIVCDWYHKGRGWVTNDPAKSSSMQRSGNNYGAILCTYGSVIYRYQQEYQ